MGISMEIYNEDMERKATLLKKINIVLVVIIAILALVLISMSFLWTPMTVSGPSMEETLQNGDKVILLTALYKIHYGDIIVFEKTEDDKNVIKRVIGLPGDHVRFSMEEKAWYRNGTKLNEDYVTCKYGGSYWQKTDASLKEQMLSEDGYLVEDDHLFVLGDNRINSNDSHIYGAISKSQIKGKYLFKY